MIGAIHKIPWKFSCYQCYVICFCDCSKLITALLFNQSLFRLLVVVFHLSVLLQCIFSSFQFLLFFQLLHFNQKCLPSKTWKFAAAQKIGREAYPHHKTIQQFRRWALSTIYCENLSNTKQDIYLFPICELPTTIYAIVELNLRQLLFYAIDIFQIY